MNIEWLSWSMAATLLFPPTASMWLRHLANQCAADQQRTKWVGCTRWVSLPMILAVPVWWSLCVLVNKSGANLGFINAAPVCVLLLIPLPTSMLIARLISYRSDGYVFGRQWTGPDIFRLAFWRTASSTLALLIVAVGIEDIYGRNIVGFAWMLGAGIVALVGKMRLRAAEGLVPRPVKSGELYKRSLVLSKRMGVPLKRVCVVPFGRGRLTNAYGGQTQIAVTDDYGHWLHGSQLDFVIGHELAHVKQKDAVKTLATMASMFFVLSAATFFIPPLSTRWTIFFNFVAIFLPLLVFYALSRHREYLADRLAVEVTGEPEMAIRALASLYRRAEVPTERSRFAELFSTHPGLWRRIDAIARLGGVSPEQVSEVRGNLMEAAAEDRKL